MEYGWIKELADQERRIESTGKVDLVVSLDQDQDLDEKTDLLLIEFRELIRGYADSFNRYRGSRMAGVKIFGIANTRADFMLFRNSLKLIFVKSSEPATSAMPSSSLSGRP